MKLNEISTGRKKLLKMVADHISQLMISVSMEQKKSLNQSADDKNQLPRPFTVDVHPFPEGYHGFSIHLMRAENIPDAVWKDQEEIIRAKLESEGFLDGSLPVNVAIRFIPDLATIAVK